jgi:hypothetical protein
MSMEFVLWSILGLVGGLVAVLGLAAIWSLIKAPRH